MLTLVPCDCAHPRTYRNRETGQSEIDYKSYLDFVLATTYKGTSEALAYFIRLLDVQRAGGLVAFDVCYFFRAVVEKFDVDCNGSLSFEVSQ